MHRNGSGHNYQPLAVETPSPDNGCLPISGAPLKLARIYKRGFGPVDAAGWEDFPEYVSIDGYASNDLEHDFYQQEIFRVQSDGQAD